MCYRRCFSCKIEYLVIIDATVLTTKIAMIVAVTCRSRLSALKLYFNTSSSIFSHIPIAGYHTPRLYIEIAYIREICYTLTIPIDFQAVIFRNLICSFSYFFLMCAINRSLASNVIKEYFPILAGDIFTPLRRLIIKSCGLWHWFNFSSMSLMRYLTICPRSSFVPYWIEFPVTSIAVSSANIAIVQFIVFGTSFT